MSLGPRDIPRPGRPPRLARWLLAWLLPRAHRDCILGDLEEEFTERVLAPDGRRGARRWYWRQTLAVAAARRPPRRIVPPSARASRGDSMLDTLRQDVWYALRGFGRQPGFTLVVVLTIALGIGANTAIFSLLDAVVLRPLPAEKPEELAILCVPHGESCDSSFNYPLFQDYRDQNQVFAHLVAWSSTAMNLTLGETSERIPGALVSWDFFDALGARPTIGRGFRPEEDRIGAGAPVAVIGDGLWRSRFGGKPDIIGSPISINGYPFTIVGVAPPRLVGVERGQAAEIFVPFTRDIRAHPAWARDALTLRTMSWLQVFGRLEPGVTREQAQAAMRALAERIRKVEPMNTETSLEVRDGRRGFMEYVETLAHPLRLLQLVVALVLLIACANVANLLLARTLARRRDVAIRRALGAGAWRLVRQSLTESLLLAGAGAVAGLVVAQWLMDLLRSLQPRLQIDAALDGRVLLFTLGVTLLAGLLFGTAPAWQSTRSAVVDGLKKDDLPAMGGGRRFGVQAGLVVVQLALSLVVLVAAGLTLKSLRGLLRLDADYDPARVMLFSIDLGRSGYDEARGRQFYAALLERVSALPEVEAAALAVVPPLSGGGMRWTATPEGRVPDEKNPINLNFNVVTPGYFRSLGIPLLRGRDFDRQDDPSAAPAVLVNESLVREYWPGEEGLGKTISLPTDPPQRAQVVGVVADSRARALTEPIVPTMFLPLARQYESNGVLLVRAPRASSIVEPVREVVRSLDAHLPVFGVRSLTEQRARSLSTPRMAATLLSLLGALGLLLGTLGLYAVMGLTVAQRTHEIGIRMALGADGGSILHMVLGQAARLVLIGLGAGLLGALAATRLITTLLYGVAPRDPATFALVGLLLAGAALAACLLPARRAVRVDPVIALRYE